MPGPLDAVEGGHGRNRCSGEPAAAITTVHDPGIFDDLAHAVLADVAIAIEEYAGAQKTIISQGLHHSDAMLSGRVVDGWR